jgi:hypothetical protein
MRFVNLDNACMLPIRWLWEDRGTLWDPPPWWQPDRLDLRIAAWFCRAHPDACVKIKLRALNSEEDKNGSALRTGYWILTGLRRQQCPWPYTRTLLEFFDGMTTDFVPIDVPDNLEFFPTNPENLTFQPVYDTARWVDAGVDPSAVNTWIRVNASWYQEGL